MASKRKSKTKEKQCPESIRDTIHLLSSLLNECGIPRVPSECFRRAKFNQEHAISDLWKLIFHTVQAVQFLVEHECCINDTLGDIDFYMVTDSNLPIVQVTMQRYLFDLGYGREEMFVNVSAVGSRELLLAFAWLLNKSAFFEILTKHFIGIASSTVVPLKPAALNLVECIIEDDQRVGTEIDNVVSFFGDLSHKSSVLFSKTDCEEALHKLIWLKSSLDLKWKSVQRSCLAYQELADKIHKSTCDGSLTSRRFERTKGHMSVHEVFLLRYPNQMKAQLKKLGHCVNVMQKLILWQESEGLFWKWMESVMDLDQELEEEEKLKKDGDNAPQFRARLDDVDVLVTKLDELQKKFKGSLERNRTHVDKLNRVWIHRSRALLHKDIYNEEQSIRKQLQFEYPIVAMTSNQISSVISMLETLAPIESCMYIPVGSIPGDSSRQAFPALAQIQREADSRLLESLRDHLYAVTRELAILDKSIAGRKLEIRNALEFLEKRLPATLCKIESNVFLAGCGNISEEQHENNNRT